MILKEIPFTFKVCFMLTDCMEYSTVLNRKQVESIDSAYLYIYIYIIYLKLSEFDDFIFIVGTLLSMNSLLLYL